MKWHFNIKCSGLRIADVLSVRQAAESEILFWKSSGASGETLKTVFFMFF